MKVLGRAKSDRWFGEIGRFSEIARLVQGFCARFVLRLMARECDCRIDPVGRLRRIGGL